MQRQISEVYPDPVPPTRPPPSLASLVPNPVPLTVEISSWNSSTTKASTLPLNSSRTATSSFQVGVRNSCTMMRTSVSTLRRPYARKGGWILHELARDRQAKSLTNVDAMDMDKPAVVLKNATLAPGSTLQPKRTRAFSQGGHLMSNKKCKP